MLNGIKIDRKFKEFTTLDSLNIEAFPKAERIDIAEITEMTSYGEVDFVAIYNDGKFIGFYLIFKKKPCAYIYFLAIHKDFRNKGYGTKLLEFIKNKYNDYQIILDLEEIDDNAKNNVQRITRKNFYLRNGFKETGYKMEYVGMRFEVLCMEENIKIDDFKNLIEITKTIINKHSSNKFEPEIFTE